MSATPPTPVTPETRVEIMGFFDEFEAASRDEQWDRYGELFAPTFLNLDPATVSPVAREALIAFLPRRKALFEQVGATGTRLTEVALTAVDGRHVLARTTWQVVFAHADTPHHTPVELESTFMLRREEQWRIVMYLNHHSLADLLRPAAP